MADLDLYGGCLGLAAGTLGCAVVIAGVLDGDVLQPHLPPSLPVLLTPGEHGPVPRPGDLGRGPDGPAGDGRLPPQRDAHHGTAGLRLDVEGVGDGEAVGDGERRLHHDPALVLSTVLLPGRGYTQLTLPSQLQPGVLGVPDAAREQHAVLLHPDPHELVRVPGLNKHRIN